MRRREMELPEECIANILSRTSPSDASRLSVVSKLFRSAAESDAVWRRFLPFDVVSTVSQSDSHSSLLANPPSMRALYLALSERPIIINKGKASFQLDRRNGKRCFMIAAGDLLFIWGEADNRGYFDWETFPESRFHEVVRVGDVGWLDFYSEMNTRALSPNTQYAAYVVFKMVEGDRFENCPVELSVGLFRGGSITEKRLQQMNVRSDGWMEIEIGTGFNSGIEDEGLQLRALEINDCALIIEGIEVRPKEDN